MNLTGSTEKGIVVQATFVFPDTAVGRDVAVVVERFARAASLCSDAKYKVTQRDMLGVPDTNLAQVFAFDSTFNLFGSGSKEEHRAALSLVLSEVEKETDDAKELGASLETLYHNGVTPVANLSQHPLHAFRDAMFAYRAWAKEEQTAGVKAPVPYSVVGLSARVKAEAIVCSFAEDDGDLTEEELAKAFDALHAANLEGDEFLARKVAAEHRLDPICAEGVKHGALSCFDAAYVIATKMQHIVNRPSVGTYLD